MGFCQIGLGISNGLLSKFDLGTGAAEIWVEEEKKCQIIEIY